MSELAPITDEFMRDQITEVMNGDPGVQAGIFTFDVHPMRSFSGDALP